MKKRKIYFIIMLGTLLTLTNITAGITTVTTLDYLESDIVVIQGNRTLMFNSSDTGTNEINLFWRMYDDDSNITVYMLESKEIVYDHTFINNTKDYIFKDNATSDEYIINVDYSSIVVPNSLYDALNDTIQEKIAIIAELMVEINHSQLLIISLNETIKTIHGESLAWMLLAEQYKTGLENETNNNGPLYKKIQDLNNMLNGSDSNSSDWENKADDLGWDLKRESKQHNDTKLALSDAIDPWSIGYFYNGQDNYHFNFVSIIIGILIALFLTIVYGEKIRNKIKKLQGKTEDLPELKTKNKKGWFAKLIGFNDARDYDELPIENHPTLDKWKNPQTNPATIAEFIPIGRSDDVGKNVDDLLLSKVNNNHRHPEVR